MFYIPTDLTIDDLPDQFREVVGTALDDLGVDQDTAVRFLALVVRELGGVNYPLPTLKSFLTGWRRRKFQEDLRGGSTPAKIAVRYGVSEDCVRDTLREARREENARRQVPLFNESA